MWISERDFNKSEISGKQILHLMSLESNARWFAIGHKLLNHTTKFRSSEKKPGVIF